MLDFLVPGWRLRQLKCCPAGDPSAVLECPRVQLSFYSQYAYAYVCMPNA